MPLTFDDIARLAKLSRLGLTDSAKEESKATLNAFFSVVEQMQRIDTEGVLPLAHPVDIVSPMALRLHEDNITDSPTNREANQRSAPNVQDGFYLVPKVIE